jgi:hypothetical protein
MRILLLAPHFSPDEHIGASRWNRLSKYLLRDGHKIYVIASSIISESTNSERASQLIRVNYQDSLMDKLLIAFGNAKKDLAVEKDRQNFQIRKNNRKAQAYNFIINLAGKIARFPGVYWWSVQEMMHQGEKIIKDKNIDIIIATHPFSVSLRAASKLSSRTNIPWIADMRDGWSSYYFGEYEKGTIFYSALKKIERYYLGTASRVVTINDILGSSLCVDKKKIVIIPNVYDPEEKLPDSSATIADNKKVVFAFAGSVHENHAWNLFFEGVKLCKSELVDNIIVNYYGGYFGKLDSKRLKYSLPENLIVNNGYLMKEDLRIQLAKADILLVFGFNGAFGDSVTTGKIFDYIETRKPVIVFGPPTSELALLVKKTGIGIVISDSKEAKNVLLGIINDKESFIASIIKKKDTNELLMYSAEEAASRYVNTIKEILG